MDPIAHAHTPKSKRIHTARRMNALLRAAATAGEKGLCHRKSYHIIIKSIHFVDVRFLEHMLHITEYIVYNQLLMLSWPILKKKKLVGVEVDYYLLSPFHLI